MISGDLLHAGTTMAVTNFMNGVFASRIVIGNTNFHILNGDLRNQLDVETISGLRIYLKADKNGTDLECQVIMKYQLVKLDGFML